MRYKYLSDYDVGKVRKLVSVVVLRVTIGTRAAAFICLDPGAGVFVIAFVTVSRRPWFSSFLSTGGQSGPDLLPFP